MYSARRGGDRERPGRRCRASWDRCHCAIRSTHCRPGDRACLTVTADRHLHSNRCRNLWNLYMSKMKQNSNTVSIGQDSLFEYMLLRLLQHTDGHFERRLWTDKTLLHVSAQITHLVFPYRLLSSCCRRRHHPDLSSHRFHAPFCRNETTNTSLHPANPARLYQA